MLLVHNFYGSASPSGENQVFESEKALLLSRGHEVEAFTRHSDEIRSRGAWGTLEGALSTPWNPWMAKALVREVDRFQPDVVHAHNTFPLISPAIFHAIGGRAARVLTLHNYRLFCAAGIPMRDGKVCVQCLDKRSSLPAIRYGCYRGRRVATVPLAFSVGLHRTMGTWTDHVDAFIALTEFQRELMSSAGLPANKVHVKANFYLGSPSVTSWKGREGYAVFVGRLSAEKGVDSLVDAWGKWGNTAPELRVVGDGDLRSGLERRAGGVPVRFLGQLSGADAQREIAGASLLVLPSVCFEGSPMVLNEAFAFGTPAAVSDIGPLPAIVRHGINGVVFQPGDSESLLREVRTAWQTPQLLERLGEGARAEFQAKYTQDANYETLMEIYERALHKTRA